MFDLAEADLARGVLDCGGGPASFVAELAMTGVRAVAVDPIYALPGDQIRARFAAVVGPMLEQVRATPDHWTWTYHRDPDDLCAHRRAALEGFLADYEAGLREHRYVVGQLPALPFKSDSFGIAVCSHLLFLYSDLLSEEFHLQSLLELCRIADEVRCFPLLTLNHHLSPHLAPVRAALESVGLNCEVVRVSYKLQRGGNQMLRICRPNRSYRAVRSTGGPTRKTS